jgi:hypothetical protein
MTAATVDVSKAAPNATFFAFAALAALTAVRLMLAKHLELYFDEVYYWYWSKNLQLSYFDRPPAVAWFIRAGTVLFGDTELGVRFFGQLSMMAATCLLFDAARRAFSLRSALIGVGSTQATLLLGAGSIIMTPDIPLLLFSTIILWSLVRFTLAHAGFWWLIVGLAGGAALLSKYTAGLLATILIRSSETATEWVKTRRARNSLLHNPLSSAEERLPGKLGDVIRRTSPLRLTPVAFRPLTGQLGFFAVEAS